MVGDAKDAFVTFRQHFREWMPKDIQDRINCINVMSVFLARHGFCVSTQQLSDYIRVVGREIAGVQEIDVVECQQVVDELVRLNFVIKGYGEHESDYWLSDSVRTECKAVLRQVGHRLI